MMVTSGAFFMGISALLVATQSLLGVGSFWKTSLWSERVSFLCAGIHFFCAWGALGILCYLHWILDFSYTVVFAHTHTHLPSLYRLGAVWSSSEGSLLLWGAILATWGGILSLSLFESSTQRAQALGLWGLLSLSFWILLLFFFDPFTRLSHAPLQGLGLNPLLHDPSLMIHPPLLYIGYAGVCVPFILSLKRWVALCFCSSSPPPPLDSEPLMAWTPLSWMFLTLGLLTGGFWAYYELGWGGYWFWDPVENVALLPWLWTTALIHWGKRYPRSKEVEFLTLLAFLFVLWGTTLTRGGLLISFHSFASLPSRTFPLVLMTLTWTLGSLILWGISLRKNLTPWSFHPFAYNPLLKIPVLFCGAIALNVALGTFFPPLFNPSVSIDASFYNSTLWILMLGPFSLMPLVPFWGRFREILPFFLLAAGIFWLILVFATVPSLKAALCLGLSLWMALGSLPLLRHRLQRAQGIAHLGVALCLCGICCSSFWKSEMQKPLMIGEKNFLGKETHLLEEVMFQKKPLFDQEKASFLLQGGKEQLLSAEKRLYHPQELITTEAALHTTPFRDLLIILGDYVALDTWLVYVSLTPGTWSIWGGGGILVILGAGIALKRRRKPFSDKLLRRALKKYQ